MALLFYPLVNVNVFIFSFCLLFVVSPIQIELKLFWIRIKFIWFSTDSIFLRFISLSHTLLPLSFSLFLSLAFSIVERKKKPHKISHSTIMMSKSHSVMYIITGMKKSYSKQRVQKARLKSEKESKGVNKTFGADDCLEDLSCAFEKKRFFFKSIFISLFVHFMWCSFKYVWLDFIPMQCKPFLYWRFIRHIRIVCFSIPLLYNDLVIYLCSFFRCI